MILSNFYWEITIKRGKNFRCFKPRTWVCSSRQNKAGNEARLDPEVVRDYPGNRRSTGQIKFGPFWINWFSHSMIFQSLTLLYLPLPCSTYLSFDQFYACLFIQLQFKKWPGFESQRLTYLLSSEMISSLSSPSDLPLLASPAEVFYVQQVMNVHKFARFESPLQQKD